MLVKKELSKEIDQINNNPEHNINLIKKEIIKGRNNKTSARKYRFTRRCK